MPLITRRRAKRREVEIHHSRAFPLGLNITKLVSGEWQVASMPAPEFSDATIRCRTCGDDFECSAEVQRRRYAVNHHNPYFLPQYCPDCSRAWHRKKSLHAEYDAKVGVARDGLDLDAKRRVLALLGELDAAGVELSGRMIYTQGVLTRQLAAAARRAENAETVHSLTRNHRPLGR